MRSLFYNGSNNILFVNATKVCQFKANDSETKKYPLCLGNIFLGFSANNLEKIELNGCVYDYKTFDTSDFINILKYLMKKHDIK